VSPDGRRIAFVRETETKESVLLVRSLIDGAEDMLTACRLPEFLDYPAWSRDGRYLAFTKTGHDGTTLHEIALTGGREDSVGRRWAKIKAFSWLPGDDGFLISAVEDGSDRFSIWALSRSGHTAKRLTPGTNSVHNVMLSDDGTRALAAVEHQLSGVWFGSLETPIRWKLLFTSTESVRAAAWAAHNRILLEVQAGDLTSVDLVNRDAASGVRRLNGGRTVIRGCARMVGPWCITPRKLDSRGCGRRI
jgi:dipeptidyl aminopeptidase/acylaminoacyl peptidase